MRRGRTRQTGIVGIYGQPRGGTNFIAAALHYHPRLFAVNEHVFDYRVPLRSMWKGGSVFREDGRQDKKIDEVDWVVFNKMQEFFPEQWNPAPQLSGSKPFHFLLPQSDPRALVARGFPPEAQAPADRMDGDA